MRLSTENLRFRKTIIAKIDNFKKFRFYIFRLNVVMIRADFRTLGLSIRVMCENLEQLEIKSFFDFCIIISKISIPNLNNKYFKWSTISGA